MEPRISEHPIIFSSPMVRAILEGRKTQTRRIIKHKLAAGNFSEGIPHCPYGMPGDRLWVRECHWIDRREPKSMAIMDCDGFTVDIHRIYQGKTTNIDTIQGHKHWRRKPSIHMPRWASRITLEIVSVRIQQLTSISEEDAKAEGFDGSTEAPGHDDLKCRAWFEGIWDKINGDGSFRSNPWVWVIEFKRIQQCP